MQHTTPIQRIQTAVNVTFTPLRVYRSEVYLTQRRSDKTRAAHLLRDAAPKRPAWRHITQRCSDILRAALDKATPGRGAPSILTIRRTPGCIYQSGVVLHERRSRYDGAALPLSERCSDYTGAAFVMTHAGRGGAERSPALNFGPCTSRGAGSTSYSHKPCRLPHAYRRRTPLVHVQMISSSALFRDSKS